jgi:SAM-dependent methyltransferase
MTVDWSAVAPQWDSHRADVEAMKTELTAQLLAGLEPLAGRRVLELGAGTGELAARLADAVGPDGSVLASDVADGMVRLLEARLGALPGLDTAQIDTAQIDAASIPLPDASVDVVVFRMGLMLMTEPEVALQEMRRVLRPGGRIAVAVWGGPQDNPWMVTVGMAAMMQGLVQGGPPLGPGGPFSLADPVELEKLVRGAGFSEVSVVAVDSTRRFNDAAQHLDVVRALAPHLSEALSRASAEQLAAVRQTVADLTAKYRSDDGLDLPSRAVLCIAA